MANVELVIKIPEEIYEDIMAHNRESREDGKSAYYFEGLIQNGIPLPKGHGRIVDIGKIDEDRIESDNPIIYLTVNGEYIEAVSLDYLNNLPTIIEADKGEQE